MNTLTYKLLHKLLSFFLKCKYVKIKLTSQKLCSAPTLSSFEKSDVYTKIVKFIPLFKLRVYQNLR